MKHFKYTENLNDVYSEPSYILYQQLLTFYHFFKKFFFAFLFNLNSID